MRRVVDASVAVKWYVPETLNHQADTLLTQSDVLYAPDLVIPEFGNIIWKKIRRSELTEGEGTAIVKAFSRSGLRIRAHRPVAHSAFVGACLSGQTVYDWTYLALAISLSCEFVTADRKFYDSLSGTSLGKHLKWLGDL
ncbi:MAG: type II toxin-antitoxin system VapC family toxin [Acidobacteriota bacterium]|nr:MAG: type II toxin-antitoxin system VapC family toxin [Acidobacteriota bacterium]